MNEEFYRYHEGSLLVKNSSPPSKVAKAIVREFERQVTKGGSVLIDVTFLGSPAAYAAFYACLKASNLMAKKHGIRPQWLLRCEKGYCVTRRDNKWEYDTNSVRIISMYSLYIPKE